MKKTVLTLAIRLYRFILRTLGASTIGARVILINNDNNILLVKHTYIPGWFLPGGGVKPNEHPKAAAIRELKEETGHEALEDPELFNVYYHKVRGVDDYPVVYTLKNSKSGTRKPNVEILDAQWFPLSSLPDDIDPSTHQRLEEFLQNKTVSQAW